MVVPDSQRYSSKYEFDVNVYNFKNNLFSIVFFLSNLRISTAGKRIEINRIKNF